MARERIEREIMSQRVRGNKEAIRLVIDLSDSGKQVRIFERDIRRVEEERARITGLLEERKAQIDKSLVSLAILIDKINQQAQQDDEELEEGQIDEIFLEDMEDGQNRRRTIAELLLRLRLLYLHDPFNRGTDQEQNLVRENTLDFNELSQVRNFN